MSRLAMLMGAASLVGVEGHICLFHPVQRGDPVPTALDPGDPLCYRRTPYCGGIPVPKDGPPSANTFLAGTEAELSFQQNLNHFWVENPGSLDVAVSYDLNPTDDSWVVLLALNDYAPNDMVTQTNFTPKVRIPAKESDHALLRFRYVSHNTGEIDPANNTESIFYNCADIRIVANPALDDEALDSETSSPVKAVESTTKDDAPTCPTPEQWEATALETTTRGLVHHRIFYDGKQQAIRWGKHLKCVGSIMCQHPYLFPNVCFLLLFSRVDRSGPLSEAGVDQTLTTISFYNETIPKQPSTTHPEYLIYGAGTVSSMCKITIQFWYLV